MDSGNSVMYSLYITTSHSITCSTTTLVRVCTLVFSYTSTSVWQRWVISLIVAQEGNYWHSDGFREAFQSKKQRNLGIHPKWWWPPPSGVGTFLNLWLYWNGLTPPPFPKINSGLFWTWDFFEAERPPKNSSKHVEYEKYLYKINQYEWYNGIFGHV